MGTSFTRYNGYGFWARDWQVEFWLALMVSQFDRQEQLTLPQMELREDFILQATAGFNGFVTPGLDEFVTDAIKDWTVARSRHALAELQSKDDPVPGDWVEGLFDTRGSLSVPMRSINRDMAIDYGEKWIALLTGTFELAETAWIGEIHEAGAKCYLKPEASEDGD